MRRVALALAWLASVAAWPALAGAEPHGLALDLRKSEVRFELAATLHTVRGTASIQQAEPLVFDPATGDASGRVAVDATSVDTDNARRDRNLHDQVLESERFPEIAFLAQGFELIDAEEERFVLRGDVEILGDTHPVVFEGRTERKVGDVYTLEASSVWPYVAWGLRDMSNLLLSVAPEVTVHLRLVGTIRPTSR